MNNFRVGTGYDVHKLVKDRPLILGGVTIPHETGLAGHSDADVLLHALIDAMLGAAALGDIGQHFPDNEAAYKNIDSRILLRKTKDLLDERSWKVGNIDATIVAQRPKLKNYINPMRSIIAEDLALSQSQVSVKATTSESLGFEGREEGISAQVSVLLGKEVK